MAYINEGIHQRAEVLQGATDSIVYFPKVDGVNVTPSSANVQVLGPSSQILLPETPVTPGPNGRLTLSQAWPLATYYLSEDYVAIFTFVASSISYSERVFFDVVKMKLLCQISHSDLLNTYPDLESHLLSLNETDTAKFIRRAWSEILDRIRSAGNRPSLLLDVRRLTNAAIELSLHYVAQALEKDTGDLWNSRKADHRAGYNREWGQIGTLKYDFNEDGQADRGEETRVARVRFHV